MHHNDRKPPHLGQSGKFRVAKVQTPAPKGTKLVNLHVNVFFCAPLGKRSLLLLLLVGWVAAKHRKLLIYCFPIIIFCCTTRGLLGLHTRGHGGRRTERPQVDTWYVCFGSYFYARCAASFLVPQTSQKNFMDRGECKKKFNDFFVALHLVQSIWLIFICVLCWQNLHRYETITIAVSNVGQCLCYWVYLNICVSVTKAYWLLYMLLLGLYALCDLSIFFVEKKKITIINKTMSVEK